jgi:hypothetical protein
MTWIAPVYLQILMERAAANAEPPEDATLTNEALEYAQRALHGEMPPPEAKPEAEPPLPEGEWARVEILGHDQVTGWITEGTRAGAPVMVIRDWDGRVLREVPGHSLYQFVPLATPLKRPEPRAAITAGFRADPDDDEYDEDPRPF